GASATSSSSFTVTTPATVQVNEVNANVTAGDLVELKVMAGGSLDGVQLRDLASDTGLATLPDITVATNDLVVVHLAADGATSETTGKTACSDAACYARAWDIRGGTQIDYSQNVVLLANRKSGNPEDAVPFVSSCNPGEV